MFKEYYRDFIGTLLTEQIRLESEIKTLNRSEEVEYYEIKELINQKDYLVNAFDYFTDGNGERLKHFKSLEELKTYISVLKNTYNTMCEYSKTVLLVECGELLGIFNNEWDEFESMRYKFRHKLEAWELFVQFCESGYISK